MAKKAPKIYEPGELDEVRKKLGNLSPDEAKRMSGVLGGDIGTEKSNSISQKEKMGQTILFKNHVKKSPRERDPGHKQHINSSAREKEKKKSKPFSKKKKKLSYIDRVRIAFLCRRSEFRIKSIGDTIASIFSFFLPFPNKVSSSFIKKLENNVYKPIFDLVKATRGLYSKVHQEIYDEIEKKRFFATILKTVKRWDLESLEMEVFHLKRNAGNQTMRTLLRLCKMIFYPIMILCRLDETQHILEAYKWALFVNREAAGKKQMDKNRIVSLYYDAEKNIPKVLNDIKKLFYPFLLTHFSFSFYEYEDFLLKDHEKILLFLELSEYDVLIPEERDNKVEIQKDENPKNETSEPEEEKTVDREYPEEVVQGIECLKKLYPRIGWDLLHEFPDLYPYFQPIYNFQNGVELIPPFDPLQQIIIILSILNDLFYAFRHVKFGLLRDTEIDAYNIQSKVDSYIALWPLYIDDIISKAYISRLVDYCRQIEKDKAYKMSEVGKKIVTELNWIKKQYFIPYQSMKFESQVAGIVKRQIPKLYVMVTELKNLLGGVVNEMRKRAHEGNKAHFESLTNPWNQYIFDLENSTSKRLNKLLHTKSPQKDGKIKIIDKRNNANLLFYSTHILFVLDYLLNDRESHLYYPPSQKIFRTIHSGSDIPQYSVETINPEAIAIELPDPDSPDVGETAPREYSLKGAIDLKVLQNKKTGYIFSIIYFNIGEDKNNNFSDGEIQIPAEELLKINVQSGKDNLIHPEKNIFILVLENCDLKMAISKAKQIINKLEQYNVSTGVFQYQVQWKYAYFLKILEKTKHFALTQGAAKLVYLDTVHHKFKSIKI